MSFEKQKIQILNFCKCDDLFKNDSLIRIDRFLKQLKMIFRGSLNSKVCLNHRKDSCKDGHTFKKWNS